MVSIKKNIPGAQEKCFLIFSTHISPTCNLYAFPQVELELFCRYEVLPFPLLIRNLRWEVSDELGSRCSHGWCTASQPSYPLPLPTHFCFRPTSTSYPLPCYLPDQSRNMKLIEQCVRWEECVLWVHCWFFICPCEQRVMDFPVLLGFSRSLKCQWSCGQWHHSVGHCDMHVCHYRHLSKSIEHTQKEP